MATIGRQNKDKLSEKFGDLFRTFTNSVGEIFDDPEFKQKAREFAESAVDATAKIIDKKIKEEEVRSKIRNVGKAAQSLGKSLEDNFKAQNKQEPPPPVSP